MTDGWKEISSWLWGLLVPIMWYLKSRSDKQADQMTEDLKNKADKSELDRQRNNIEKLFGESAELRKDMNGGFERITHLIHHGQTQILTELAKKQDRRNERGS